MKHTDERTRPVPPPPSRETVRLVDRHGRRRAHPSFAVPDPAVLAELHRAMVIGRRFNQQTGDLARAGRLAVHPSSAGREAAQVGGVLALRAQDWLFPGYRDGVAMITHGVDPLETLALFGGDRRCGYDPHRHRCAPPSTPLAANASHAVGLTYAARTKGRDVAALVLMGDGTTGEGDVHEAYDFAAVWNTPVVFLVQTDQRTAGVPPHDAGPAPTSTRATVGSEVRGYRVDGNDAAAVYAVVARALAEARAGEGPAIVEALTHRVDRHTDADLAQRQRDDGEAAYRAERDPLLRSEALLRGERIVDDGVLEAYERDAARVTVAVDDRLAGEDGHEPSPPSTEDHAEVRPTPARR